MAAVVVVGAMFLAACSLPGGAPTSPSQLSSKGVTSADALLAAASKASAARPVRIVGYELVLWQDGRFDFEVFMTKSGRLLSPRRNWGAVPEFSRLEKRPPARLQPESEPERQARGRAIARALELSAAEGWGSDEAMVRIYLLQDASGSQFLISPDGAKIAKAPELAPWGNK